MERALPTGSLKIHSESKGVVNPTGGRQGVAEITKRLNSVENLEQTFHNPNNPRVLHYENFPDGSQVSLYNQTGKYSETSALVIAKGPRTYDVDGGEPVATETIYDYPSPVQEAYWQQILASMAAFRKNSPVDGMRVFAGENCISTYSNDEHRTSRSIANPHTHIVGFIDEHIDKGEVIQQIPNLSEEKSITDRISSDMVKDIHSLLPSDIQTELHFVPRRELPSGYTFTIQGDSEELAAEPKEFTRIMQEHHKAYTQVAKKIEDIDDSKVIPQPSYRLYLENVDGKTYVSVSPEILSHAGVMEAAGVVLNRNADNPERLAPEMITQVQQATVKEVQLITDNESGKKPPFMDSVWMDTMKAHVYEKAQPQAQKTITPDSKYCFYVNPQLKETLVEEGIQAEYIKHEDEFSHRGVIKHAFVKANYDETTYIVDMQYKQFVPEDMRGGLPDYLVIPYKTKHDIATGLRDHRVPDRDHDNWIEELFPEPVTNSNLSSSPAWRSKWSTW